MKLIAPLLSFALLLSMHALVAADSRVFELRIYTTPPGKLDDLKARFRNHTRKLFEKHGITNIGYWIPTQKDQGADDKLIYIIAHKSREAAKESWAAFGKDPDWQAARKASEENGKLLAKPPESIYMTATDFSPKIQPAAADTPRVFQLRIYKTPPGKLDNLLARFRGHTVGLFAKHGMTNIGYWVPTDKDKGADNTLIYIVAHKSREAAEESWKAFRADPDWIKAKAESEAKAGGSLTLENGVESIYMTPMD